jgi:hypothetical protein
MINLTRLNSAINSILDSVGETKVTFDGEIMSINKVLALLIESKYVDQQKIGESFNEEDCCRMYEFLINNITVERFTCEYEINEMRSDLRAEPLTNVETFYT